jgi:dTDP-D-glucose 4,6-dehydratase
LTDGKTIDLNPAYAYNSPYMQSKAGSDIVTLSYGTRKWKYDFGENTVEEAKE